MLRHGFSIALLCSLGSLACGQIKVSNAPEGAMHITCNKGMKDCVTRAQKTCGEKGYQILSGTSRTKLLGGSSSPYRKLSESGELDVRCGAEEAPVGHDIVFKLPKRTDDPIPEETGVASSERVCVPGATARCIGPGACEGGQVCLSDGSAFGPCDCGPSSPPAAQRPPPVNQPPVEPEPRPEAPPTDTELPGAMPPPEPLGE